MLQSIRFQHKEGCTLQHMSLDTTAWLGWSLGSDLPSSVELCHSLRRGRPCCSQLSLGYRASENVEDGSEQVRHPAEIECLALELHADAVLLENVPRGSL
eukprot:3374903-Amphidinium_carterae.1